MKGDLLAAIEAGDAERVRDLVVAAPEKERRGAAPAVEPVFTRLRATWDESRRSPRRAAMLARLGTATARQVVSDWWAVQSDPGDSVYGPLAAEVIAARGSAFAQTVVNGFMREEMFHDWVLVRALVRASLVERPDEYAYIRTMVLGIDGVFRHERLDSVYTGLRADPDLLEDELWSIFEVDVGADLASAHTWTLRDPNDRKQGYERGDNRWTYALLTLVEEGAIERERLLRASLDALARDFRPSNLAWYSSLHDALEPTDTEREALVDKYLALLAVPAPYAMKAGLAGLRAMGKAVPADALARAATAPLTQKQKNIAVQTLALLADAAERDPSARAVVLEAVADALGHERPDVQERALVLLERYPDEAPRAALLGLVDAVSPTLRERVATLVGVELAAPATPRTQVDAPERTGPQALAPVDSLDELIELTAALLEGQGDGDDAERFLDGVSRLCGERPRGFERRTAGLLKQADAPQDWFIGGSGRGLVSIVVQAWIDRRRVTGQTLPHTLLGFVGERALEVAHRARRGSARELLAFPTHTGGRLDPNVLAERESRTGRFLKRADEFDRVQARLRALPGDTPLEFQIGVQEHELVVRPAAIPAELEPLRKVLDPVKTTPSWWGVRSAWASWDTLGARWSLTVAPTHPEIAFAGAAVAAADALESSPQLHPEPGLELALDPNVRLGLEAWLLVAVALVAKSPDLRRAATDVVVATISDRRFDPGTLGAALALLTERGLAKPSRLDGPFRDAGRVSELHAEQILRLLESYVTRCSSTPHGLHGPVEAALEHAVSARLSLAGGRDAFERIAAEVSASSKLGRLTRRLLELQGTQSAPR